MAVKNFQKGFGASSRGFQLRSTEASKGQWTRRIDLTHWHPARSVVKSNSDESIESRITLVEILHLHHRVNSWTTTHNLADTPIDPFQTPLPLSTFHAELKV